MTKLLLYTPSFSKIQNLESGSRYVVDEYLTFMEWSPLRPTAGDHLVAKNLKHWFVNIFSLRIFRLTFGVVCF